MHRLTVLWMVLGAVHAHAAQLDATVTDSSGAPLADVVIIAVDNQHPGTMSPPSDLEIENQIDKQFVPRLLVVPLGSLVHFPNKDNIRHQVYSFSPAKRFELPLYGGAEAPPVLFDAPGPVALGCNIHDWMRGHIYVADSPWFAQSDETGSARITLPPGQYTVRVWHAQMIDTEKVTEQVVTVSDQTTQPLRWQLKLKPLLRPRRAPVGDVSGGY